MSQQRSSRVLAVRRRSHIDLGLAAKILAMTAAVGCGPVDGADRRAISGIVTLDGRPLDDGVIHLEPEANGSSTAVGATIRRGAFAISGDRGPRPGSYRVRIYASSGAQAPPARGQTDRTRRPMVERLPGIYNTRTELRANVTASGPNRFRFELLSVAPDDST